MRIRASCFLFLWTCILHKVSNAQRKFSHLPLFICAQSLISRAGVLDSLRQLSVAPTTPNLQCRCFFAIGKSHARDVYDTCPQRDSHSSSAPGLSPSQTQALSLSNWLLYSASSLQFRAALELKCFPGKRTQEWCAPKTFKQKGLRGGPCSSPCQHC